MSFSLNDDRVAVIADEVSETTEAGLFVPDSGQNPLRFGTVAVVGNGRRGDLGRVPLDFEVDDRVFFHKHSGQPMEIMGTLYVILAPAEIIGTVTTWDEVGAEMADRADDPDGTMAEDALPDGAEKFLMAV